MRWLPVALAALAFLPLLPAPAAALANANVYALWPAQTAGQLEATIRVGVVAPATFWAVSWADGYAGIQTDGNDFGTTEDIAIFSVWGATASSGNCEAGNEGGPYVSCRVHLSVESKPYQFNLRVDDGTWTASVNDTVIGEITGPGDLSSVSNFIEYFGTAPTCPEASAKFWLDGASRPSGSAQGVGCPSTVHTYPWGAFVELGG